MGKQSKYLADAIDKVSKEEARRANEELLPSGSVSERNPKQRPVLLFVFHFCLVLPRFVSPQHKESTESLKVGFNQQCKTFINICKWNSERLHWKKASISLS